MSGWFGKKGRQGNGLWSGQGGASGRSSGPRGVAWRATAFVLLSVLAAWLMSGVFVLQPNQRAAVFRLGKFHRMADAGLHWILPYPIESHELLTLAESGSVAIGDMAAPQHSGLSGMQLLTADGSIVEVRLLAQYRIRDMRQYVLTQTQDVERLVQLAGASAVRSALAGMSLAELAASDAGQIARRVQTRLQAALDAANNGIEITAVTAAADAVRAPQALQTAYTQVAQAREQKAQAVAQAASAASQALAAARQEAARLQDEAQTYKRQVVAEAQAASEQFAAVLPEYQKAPQATRDRLYYDTMQQAFSQMNKVIVDSQSGQPIHIAVQRPQAAASAASAPDQAAVEPPARAARPATSRTAAGAAAGASAATLPAQGAPSAAGAVSAADNPARSRDPALLRQRR